jgi:tetratricopeptide (TPR) repeat protein
LIDQDSVAALNAYKQSIRQNPNSADSYLEVARLSLIANDHAQLTQALENALRVDPTTPSVNWEAANLYLAVNEVDRALPLFRAASAASPEYSSPAMTLCWRATHNVDQMVALAMPQDPAVYSEFLRYLVLRRETQAADELWSRLIDLRKPTPAKASFLYLDSLIEQHRVSDAVRAWRQLATIDTEINSYLPENGNLVVNSGFKQEILNGGFDWRIAERDKVSLEVAAAADGNSGGHSLEITFDSVNTDTAGILQLIPVEPDSSYSLSFFYKAVELEGAHGMSVVIRDAFTGNTLLATDEILGSTPWQKISQTFTTAPSTSLVSFELKRPGGTLVRGKLLIDDVRLVKE